MNLLKSIWAAMDRRLAAAVSAQRTAHELRGLNDHFLKDIGLRRDQIGCITRIVC